MLSAGCQPSPPPDPCPAPTGISHASPRSSSCRYKKIQQDLMAANLFKLKSQVLLRECWHLGFF